MTEPPVSTDALLRQAGGIQQRALLHMAERSPAGVPRSPDAELLLDLTAMLSTVCARLAAETPAPSVPDNAPDAESLIRRAIERQRATMPTRRRRKPAPLWSRIQRLLGHGMTYSVAICERYGFDPFEVYRPVGTATQQPPAAP